MSVTSYADTDFNCTPVLAEIKGSVYEANVYRQVNIGPYTNELTFVSSTIPGSADLTALKEAIKLAFTSSNWVKFNDNVTFSAINYVPGTYTFNVGSHSNFNLFVANNQANIALPGSGSYVMHSWTTMNLNPVRVALPTLLNGQFTVQANGLLGYFFVYQGLATERRFDIPVAYNCTATSSPSLVINPTEIDFGTVNASSDTAATVERTLTVTVAQAGVSGQVGIEFINPDVIDSTKIPMGSSYIEILNPTNSVAVRVSTVSGQNGLLLTRDKTDFIIRLHPKIGSYGLKETTLTINVVWI